MMVLLSIHCEILCAPKTSPVRGAWSRYLLAEVDLSTISLLICAVMCGRKQLDLSMLPMPAASKGGSRLEGMGWLPGVEVL